MYQESLLPTFPVALGVISFIAVMILAVVIQIKVQKHRQNGMAKQIDDIQECLTCE
jgi:hypothetical protein